MGCKYAICISWKPFERGCNVPHICNTNVHIHICMIIYERTHSAPFWMSTTDTIQQLLMIFWSCCRCVFQKRQQDREQQRNHFNSTRPSWFVFEIFSSSLGFHWTPGVRLPIYYYQQNTISRTNLFIFKTVILIQCSLAHSLSRSSISTQCIHMHVYPMKYIRVRVFYLEGSEHCIRMTKHIDRPLQYWRSHSRGWKEQQLEQQQ